MSNVTLVQSLYAAFLRRDLPAIAALISPDIEISQSPDLPWGGTYRGPDGLQHFLANLTAHLHNSALPISHYLDAGDHVVAIGRTQGTVKSTGKPFDVPLAHIWTLHHGKATRFTPYIDHPPMLAALTPSPQPPATL